MNEFVIPIHSEELLLKRKDRYCVEELDIMGISETILISKLDGFLPFFFFLAHFFFNMPIKKKNHRCSREIDEKFLQDLST